MKHTIIYEIISFLLVFLFVYAAVSKLTDFKGFVSDMNNQPFPNSWTPVLTWLIPSVEIGIALCLLFERTALYGLYSSAVVMTAFSIYAALVLLHVFHYVPCSCGGVIKKLSWKQHLVFNLFFVFTSIAGIVIKKSKPTILNLFMHENRSSRKPV